MGTDVLTYGQGIRIMIDSTLFIIFFLIFLMVGSPSEPHFANLIVSWFLFTTWLTCVVIISNISLTMSIPSSREADTTNLILNPNDT